MKSFILATAFLLCAIAILAQDTTYKINWPKKYEPSISKFYVHNEIFIHASPDRIWYYLIHAKDWPTWYNGAKSISYLNTAGLQLTDTTIFQWETMGLQFQSIIKAYETNKLLAWESNKKSIQGYHVWLIIPFQNGCKVITDESQNGWLTFFEKTFQGKKLKPLHDIWLNELKKKAEAPLL